MAPLPIEEKGRIIYISEPLENDMPIVGQFEVGLFLSLDAPDTDLPYIRFPTNQISCWIPVLAGYQRSDI